MHAAPVCLSCVRTCLIVLPCYMAQVNSCDELIATELIFENLLTTLEPPEAMAILSMLVFEESSSTTPDLNAALLEAKQKVENIVSCACCSALWKETDVDAMGDAGEEFGTCAS